MIIKNNWQVGYANTKAAPPNTYTKAVVPGAVQLDWANTECWEDFKYSDNYKKYGWMEDVFWTYKTTLTFPKLSTDEQLFFVSKGIDYEFSVYLNDDEIYSQEGMFTPVELDLSGIAKDGDEFRVVVHPTPKRAGAPEDRSQADQSCKPAVSYGWDWHPRLIPLGIWDDTYFEVRKSVRLHDVEVTYVLNSDYSTADIQVGVWLSCAQRETLIWKFYDPDGSQVFEEKASFETASPSDVTCAKLSYALQTPRLWWPNGQGEPNLYRSEVVLFDETGAQIDQIQSKVGFRRVKLVMHEGGWEFPAEFPKSRSNSPAVFEVNGREIFAKGSNWVNPEIFPGLITRSTYEPLIELAKDAHMNVLRSWGGGIINKESFFDLCDEHGIMVWQEFPLACNDYFDSPEYLKVLDQESKSIIKRLRRHACLALWCGGNELFNAWSGMTEQSLALRLLDRNCFELDPGTPFIMTSPLSGMGHGPYKFRDMDAGSPQYGLEVFEIMQRASNTAYTEFGCPGPSPAEYIREFIPKDELFPPKAGGAWTAHHGFNAFGDDAWLEMPCIEHYFGAPASLEELVERGQWLQCEGLKSVFEEARRQRPRSSMALNWCFNEPWPSGAGSSIVNWPAMPKPAYYSVKNACRPVLASARISKFSWAEGELFAPEIWLLSDLPEMLKDLKVRVDLSFVPSEIQEITLLEWVCPEIPANSNAIGPVVRFVLPKIKSDSTQLKMLLRLTVENHSEMDSEYALVFLPDTSSKEKTTRMLNQ